LKNKKKKKIYKDKRGREYIKEPYFVGGKMKFQRIFVIDDIPAEEYYDRNATDLDHFMNGEYWLMKCEQDSIVHIDDGFDAEHKGYKTNCMWQNSPKNTKGFCEELNELKLDIAEDDIPY